MILWYSWNISVYDLVFYKKKPSQDFFPPREWIISCKYASLLLVYVPCLVQLHYPTNIQSQWNSRTHLVKTPSIGFGLLLMGVYCTNLFGSPPFFASNRKSRLLITPCQRNYVKQKLVNLSSYPGNNFVIFCVVRQPGWDPLVSQQNTQSAVTSVTVSYLIFQQKPTCAANLFATH